MAKTIILSRPDDASPKILAQSLKTMLDQANWDAEIVWDTSFLGRLLPLFGKEKGHRRLAFRLKEKLVHLIGDFRMIQKLKNANAIVLSECTPTGFWRNCYGIEQLRKKLGPNIPIIYHEVYYLGNTPHQIEQLSKDGHYLQSRYDWHLAITEVTEIRGKPSPPWSCIGLHLESTGLKPLPKDGLFAIVDFEREGYEEYRRQQIECLERLEIPYVSFEQRMPMAVIRDYYQKAGILFLQFPEAFGVPIAECLACGTAIFTPSSVWAMSWRLDECPQMHGEGILPGCFYVYDGDEALYQALREFKENFDPILTPKTIHEVFLAHYPHLYYGNKDAVKEFTARIESGNFGG